MIRELARLALGDLSVPDRVWAALGGAVGGALAMTVLHIWPQLLDPIRPR